MYMQMYIYIYSKFIYIYIYMFFCNCVCMQYVCSYVCVHNVQRKVPHQTVAAAPAENGKAEKNTDQ